MSDHSKDAMDRLKFDTSRRALVSALQGAGDNGHNLDQFVGRGGGVAMSVGMQDGQVVVAFAESIAQFTVTPQKAADLAGLLLRAAKAIARTTGDTVAWPVIG